MKRRIVSLFFIFSLLLSAVPYNLIFHEPVMTAEATTWNSNWVNWSYYRVININNNSYSGFYQMLINVSYSGSDNTSASPPVISCNGHCNANFSDIRFVQTDNTTTLPYWIEKQVNSSYAWFWVNVSAQAMSDGRIIMYYGNPNATNQSNGDATFLFFDDFDGTSLNTTKWQYQENAAADNYTITDSAFKTIVSSGGKCGIVSQSNFSLSSCVIETKCKTLTEVAGGSNTENKLNDVQSINAPSSYATSLSWYNGSSGGYNRNYYINGGWAGAVYLYQPSSPSSTYIIEQTTKNGSSFTWKILDLNYSLLGSSRTDTVADFTFYITLITGDSGSDMFDWVRIRKYVSPEPSFSSFGVETSQSNTAPFASNLYPPNGATDIPLQFSHFNITISDADGNLMNITWQWNDNGTWKTFNITSNVHNGTYYAYNTSWVNSYGTTYQWRVCVNDGNGGWSNQTYSFTTKYYIDSRVHTYTISPNYDWRALFVQWDGNAKYYNNIIVSPIAREYSSDGSTDYDYSGYIVWFNMSNQTGGIYHAIDNTYASHTGGDIAIDKNGYLWMVTGGYADYVPITLYRSNNSLDFRNWTKVATVSTTTGACSASVFVNDTFVDVVWRNGANDDSNTKEHLNRYWKTNFTLNKSIDIAVGGYSNWTLTNCYTEVSFEPQTNETFLTWSYKHTNSPDQWGSYPFIKVVNMGDDFEASNGTSYSALDKNGDGLMNFDELDIPYNNLLLNVGDGSMPHTMMGRLPNGSLYFAFPQLYNSSDPYNYTANISFSNGNVWYGYKTLGLFYKEPCRFSVFDTKDYIGVLYANGSNLYMQYSTDNGKTWSNATTLLTSNDSIMSVSVATPSTYNDIDNTVRFFYTTTYATVAPGNYRSYLWANNRVFFGYFNVTDFALPPSNNPPSILSEQPSNTSTGIVLQPTCSITVNDTDNDVMNVYWYENTTGSWVLRQTNTSVSSGSTVTWKYTQANQLDTTYYWKVAVNDSKSNVTAIYYFTTNNPPVANNDSYTMDEDMTLTVNASNGVLANDTDADGDTLTAVLVSNPSHGSLTLNSNGSFTYTPDANYFGYDTFTYKVYDGKNYSNVATVNITINHVGQQYATVYDYDTWNITAYDNRSIDFQSPTYIYENPAEVNFDVVLNTTLFNAIPDARYDIYISYNGTLYNITYIGGSSYPIITGNNPFSFKAGTNFSYYYVIHIPADTEVINASIYFRLHGYNSTTGDSADKQDNITLNVYDFTYHIADIYPYYAGDFNGIFEWNPIAHARIYSSKGKHYSVKLYIYTYPDPSSPTCNYAAWIQDIHSNNTVYFKIPTPWLPPDYNLGYKYSIFIYDTEYKRDYNVTIGTWKNVTFFLRNYTEAPQIDNVTRNGDKQPTITAHIFNPEFSDVNVSFLENSTGVWKVANTAHLAITGEINDSTAVMVYKNWNYTIGVGNKSLHVNTTVSFIYNNASGINITYYYNITANNSYTETQYVSNFTTPYNAAPTVTNAYPEGNVGIPLRPLCHIEVNDAENDTMTVYWYENTTGVWKLQQINESVQSGDTVYWKYENASQSGTTYYWKVAINDGTNNATFTYSFVPEDLNPPSVSILTPSDQATLSGDYNFTWNATDDSGLSEVRMQIAYEYGNNSDTIYDTGWLNYTDYYILNTTQFPDTPTLDAGSDYNVLIQVKDTAGNVGSDVKRFYLNNTHPTSIKAIYPISNVSYTNVTFKCEIQDWDSPSEQNLTVILWMWNETKQQWDSWDQQYITPGVSYDFTNHTWVNQTISSYHSLQNNTTYRYKWEVDEIKNGNYYYLTATSPINFSTPASNPPIDDEAPSINISYPSWDQEVKGTIVVRWNATDNATPQEYLQIKFQYMSGVNNTTYIDTGWQSYFDSYTLDTTQYPDGDMRIAVYAKDNSSNDNMTDCLIVVSNINKIPHVSFTYNTTLQENGTLLLQAHDTSIDDDGSIAESDWYLYFGDNLINGYTGSDYTYYLTQRGTYKLQHSVTDNDNATNSTYVYINASNINHLPTATLFQPDNNSEVSLVRDDPPTVYDWIEIDFSFNDEDNDTVYGYLFLGTSVSNMKFVEQNIGHYGTIFKGYDSYTGNWLSFSPDGLTFNTTYYFTIHLYDGKAWNNNTGWYEFTTKPNPYGNVTNHAPQVSAVEPADYVVFPINTTTTSITFRYSSDDPDWTLYPESIYESVYGVPERLSVYLYLSKDNAPFEMAGSRYNISYDNSDGSFVLNLPEGHYEYYFEVKDSQGATAQSNIKHFTIGIVSPPKFVNLLLASPDNITFRTINANYNVPLSASFACYNISSLTVMFYVDGNMIAVKEYSVTQKEDTVIAVANYTAALNSTHTWHVKYAYSSIVKSSDNYTFSVLPSLNKRVDILNAYPNNNTFTTMYDKYTVNFSITLKPNYVDSFTVMFYVDGVMTKTYNWNDTSENIESTTVISKYAVSSNATHSWYVKIIYGAIVKQSPTYTFTVQKVKLNNPPVVYNVQPENGAVNVSIPPIISFSIYDDDSKYWNVRVYDNNNNLIHSENTTQKHIAFTWSVYELNTTYSFYIEVSDEDNNVRFPDTGYYTFTTVSQFSVPVITFYITDSASLQPLYDVSIRQIENGNIQYTSLLGVASFAYSANDIGNTYHFVISKDNYTTVEKAITITTGTQSIYVKMYHIAPPTNQSKKDIFSLWNSQFSKGAKVLIAIIITAIFSLLGAAFTQSPTTPAFISIAFLIGFTYIGWLPFWILMLLLVIVAAILMKMMGVVIPFGGEKQ